MPVDIVQRVFSLFYYWVVPFLLFFCNFSYFVASWKYFCYAIIYCLKWLRTQNANLQAWHVTHRLMCWNLGFKIYLAIHAEIMKHWKQLLVRKIICLLIIMKLTMVLLDRCIFYKYGHRINQPLSYRLTYNTAYQLWIFSFQVVAIFLKLLLYELSILQQKILQLMIDMTTFEHDLQITLTMTLTMTFDF